METLVQCFTHTHRHTACVNACGCKCHNIIPKQPHLRKHSSAATLGVSRVSVSDTDVSIHKGANGDTDR